MGLILKSSVKNLSRQELNLSVDKLRLRQKPIAHFSRGILRRNPPIGGGAGVLRILLRDIFSAVEDLRCGGTIVIITFEK